MNDELFVIVYYHPGIQNYNRLHIGAKSYLSNHNRSHIQPLSNQFLSKQPDFLSISLFKTIQHFISINTQFVIHLNYKLSWCRFYLKNTFYQLFLFSIIFPKHIFRTTFQTETLTISNHSTNIIKYMQKPSRGTSKINNIWIYTTFPQNVPLTFCYETFQEYIVYNHLKIIQNSFNSHRKPIDIGKIRTIT